MISFLVHLSGAVTITEDGAPLREIPWGVSSADIAREIKNRIETYDKPFGLPERGPLGDVNPNRTAFILEWLKVLGVETLPEGSEVHDEESDSDSPAPARDDG